MGPVMERLTWGDQVLPAECKVSVSGSRGPSGPWKSSWGSPLKYPPHQASEGSNVDLRHMADRWWAPVIGQPRSALLPGTTDAHVLGATGQGQGQVGLGPINLET